MAISEEQAKAYEIIHSIEQFYNLQSHTSLINIIMNQRLATKLFAKERVGLLKMFEIDKKEKAYNEKIQLFAEKYTYERLCQKFSKPRGTNEQVRDILRLKIKKQTISGHNTRKQIWMIASSAKYYMKSNKDLYQNLHTYTDYPDCFSKPIQLDLYRTVARAKQNSPDQISILRRILTSFSRRNPYIGYCQGLNFITHFILTMQFNEQESFWLLSLIMQTVIPMDYYTNMTGVVSDQKVFTDVLKLHNPKVFKKFEEVGLDPAVFTIEWFVCLYTSSLPFYLVKIVWDRLLIEGMTAMIKAGLIILDEFQPDILLAQQFPQIILTIEERSMKLTISEDDFNRRFEKIFLHKEGLKLARELYREMYLKERLKEKVVKNRTQSPKNIKCDQKWPICLMALEKQRKDRQDVEVWTFRNHQQPNIIHDYCESMEQKRILKGSFMQDDESKFKNNNLVMGRIEHICEPQSTAEQPQQFVLQAQETTQKQYKKLDKFKQNINMIMEIGDQDFQDSEVSSPDTSQMEKSNQSNKSKPWDPNKAKSIMLLQKSSSMLFFKKFAKQNKQIIQITTKGGHF